MKYITKTIIAAVKRIVSKDTPKPVGRWRIEDCSTKMNNKVDLSNEDHCGPCGQYALDKIESTNKTATHNSSSSTNF